MRNTCPLSFPSGDRIAIISNGSLLCCGSFEFLRRRFGRGHRLTLVTATKSERHPSNASRTITVTAEIEATDHAPTPSDHSPFPSLTEDDRTDRISQFIQVECLPSVATLYLLSKGQLTRLIHSVVEIDCIISYLSSG